MNPFRRVRTLFRRNQLDRDMAEEMRFHVDERTDDHVDDGLPPDEARAAAHRKFGGVAQIQEASRDIRSWIGLENLWRDIRFVARSLRKTPGFTVLILTTLALGIGANTAMFSVFHTVLLQPLPYPQSERLVAIWESHPDRSERYLVSSGSYLDWVEQNSAFEEIGAWAPMGAGMLVDDVPEMATGARATTSLFRTLGVPPLRGRGFLNDAESESTGREILISQSLWQSRFGGRDDIVGQLVHLDDTPMTIIGVMPASFTFPNHNTQFWLALRFNGADHESRKTHTWRVVARLKSGETPDSAQAAIDVIVSRARQAFPEIMTGWGARVVPYHADLVRTVRPMMLILIGVALAVLLVACANAANLMLLRTVGRHRELAIRSALGAARGSLSRQLLTEAVLLAGWGGGLGLLLANWSMRPLTLVASHQIPSIETIELNQTALAASLVATALSIAVIGLLPFWRLRRTNVHTTLRSGREESGGTSQRGAQRTLVIGQLAFATALLVGTGLLLRSLERLQRVDYGFDPERLLVVSINLPRIRYQSTNDQAGFYNELRRRVESIAGVTAVAATAEAPLTNTGKFSFVIAGRPRPGSNPRENPVEVRAVTPNLFDVMRTPLLGGRSFDERDAPERPEVAIVNESFARTHFPADAAIGHRISFDDNAGPWVEIVGVVGDVKDAGLDTPASPAIYLPYVQKRWLWMSTLYLIIRTNSEPTTIGESVRQAIRETDSLLPVRGLAPMTTVYENRNAGRRFAMYLVGGFAVLTLTLGLIGVHGVVSFSIAQRQRELGIRSALGASHSRLIVLVLKEGVVLGAFGTLGGVVGALFLSRFLQSLLFEISPVDPITMFAVATILPLGCLFALVLPARRAAKVDPIIALRAE